MSGSNIGKFGFAKLGTDNYATWSTRMQALLWSKELGEALEDAAHAGSTKAKGLLIMCVEDQHLPTIMAADSAAYAWEALANLYRQHSTARLLQLKRELATLKKRADEDVAEYVARARNVANQIEATGQDVDEDNILHSVLSGLPSKYDMVRTIMTTADELPSLSDALAKLLLVEGDGRERNTGNSEQAYFSGTGGKMPKPGTKVYVPPHKRNGQGGPSKGKETRPCWYCKKKGHLKADCRKLKADIASGKVSADEGNSRSYNQAAIVALAASEVLTAADAVEKPKLPWILTAQDFDIRDPVNQWVIDSGAGKHVTGYRDILQNYRLLEEPRRLVYGDGNELEAVGVGDVIMARSLSPDNKVVVQDVLHVPGNKMNLLSISAATAKGAKVEFNPDAAYIYSGDELLVGAAKNVNGLYMLYTPPVYETDMCLIAKPKESAELWHRRFGHIGYSGLERLVREEMVKGLSITPQEIQDAAGDMCDTCTDAKQARKPFKAAEEKSTRILDLVHMDLCGPMPETSLAGNSYVLTMLDDCSKLSYITPLKKKSDTIQAVKDGFAYLEKQGKQRIREARTDNGSEFINSHLDGYFKAKGINHQRTTPYTPEQNGKAERLNRTLMEKTRAMLLEANLPKDLWGEAIATANYLRNRAPVAGRSKTPWELFYGTKPDVSHLRAFGSTALVHIPKTYRNKLDNHSERGIMVGYMPGSNGYRILLDSGITTSRDVVFKERAAPKQTVSEPAPKDEGNGGNDDKEPDRDTDDEKESDGEGYDQPPDGGDSDSGSPDSGGNGPAGPPSGNMSNIRVSSRANKGSAPGEWWRTTAATAAEMAIPEPETLQEAMRSEEAEFWKSAMQEELASLHGNNTYVLEMPPEGVKPIPCKWVFKLKKDATGGFERFKARLVVKGFRQKEGVDYDEVFAPVSKFTSARALFSKAAAEGMEIHHVDIKTAFLNGELEETIYMQQPPGFEEGPPGMACRLIKSLYGLKQAPRAWYTRLIKELELYGFKASPADPSLFTLDMKDGKVYLLVYVDDILVSSKSREMIDSIKEKLLKSFDGKDLGEIKSFLGMNITRDKGQSLLKIDQKGLTETIIQEFGLEEGKTRNTPFGTSGKLTATEGELLNTQKYPYSTLVGKLMYLTVATRPDLSYSVGALTRFMAEPRLTHWQAAKGVVRYLANTTDKGITYRGSSTELHAYCDADYAGDIDTRRSTTGYVFLMNGGAISWNSKRQPTVAASTTEAEYMAAAAAVKEGLWMRKLLSSLDIKLEMVNIKCDNQSAIKLLKNPIFSARSKHIDIIHHFARERVLRKEVAFQYVWTKEMIADIMTKPLAVEQHKELCRKMGIV